MTEEEQILLMHEVFAGIRGTFQGFKRGFYKGTSIQLKPSCLGSESIDMGYEIYKIFQTSDWVRLYEVPGFSYEIYLSMVSECQMEELVYDIQVYCDTNDCAWSSIVAQDESSIF